MIKEWATHPQNGSPILKIKLNGIPIKSLVIEAHNEAKKTIYPKAPTLFWTFFLKTLLPLNQLNRANQRTCTWEQHYTFAVSREKKNLQWLEIP